VQSATNVAKSEDIAVEPVEESLRSVENDGLFAFCICRQKLDSPVLRGNVPQKPNGAAKVAAMAARY
jgi:hypothetical protein